MLSFCFILIVIIGVVASTSFLIYKNYYSSTNVSVNFLLPNKNEKPKVRIQPYGAVTYKDFDALQKSSTQYDLGANFLLDGHHSKITTQYSTRPVYSAPGVKENSKGEFIVQLQIYL